MDTNPNWKDYIDAKDDAIESRLKTQLSDLATAREVRNNVWGAIGAALAVALATLAFGGDRFDGGMSASSLLREQATIQDRKDKEQDARLQIMDDKLDILIKQTAAK